jgi:hypothetical protein
MLSKQTRELEQGDKTKEQKITNPYFLMKKENICLYSRF